MWHDLFVALALAMVIEGLLPFLNPRGYRRMVELMAQTGDRGLRITGLILMITGAVLVYILKH